MNKLFLELTKEEITTIFGGDVGYRWVYNVELGRYIQILVNI